MPLYDSAGSIQTAPEQGAVQRVSAGLAAPGQSVKQLVGKVALSNTGVTTVSWYTPTSGKTLVVTDVILAIDDSTPNDAQLLFNAVPMFRTLISTTAPCNAAGMETQPNVAGDGTHAVSLQFAQASAAGKNATYYVAGIEQ